MQNLEQVVQDLVTENAALQSEIEDKDRELTQARQQIQGIRQQVSQVCVNVYAYVCLCAVRA